MVERVEQVIANGVADRLSLNAIAMGVIEALMEPTPEMVKAGERSFTGSTYLGLHQGQLNGLIAAYSAMLRTALSQPNDEGEGK